MKTKIYDVKLENGCGDDITITVIHDDEQEAVRIAKEIASDKSYEHFYLNCTDLFRVTSREVEIKEGTVLGFSVFDHECGIGPGDLSCICPD